MKFFAYNTVNISGYRPDIDGLRAIAILTVVLFHAFPEYIKGGFIGVDIFFVISGYLISNIIFRWLSEDKFSFAKFYANRIKRLFPALLFTLLACLILGYFVLLPDEFATLGKHSAAGIGFIQNIVLYLEVNYFDAAAELKPLLHLWSLGVEEQFYIIFPLVMFFLWRIRRSILIALTILLLTSFVVNAALLPANPSAAYYLPYARMWEPLAGCLLGYMVHFHGAGVDVAKSRLLCKLFSFNKNPTSARLPQNVNSFVSIIALALLLLALVVVDRDTPFPGWWGLLPIASAFCFIMAGPQAIVNRLLLHNKLMVGIGLISYPLYLWHWPLLSFVRITENGQPEIPARMVVVGLSFLLATITYLFVERWFRLKASKAKIISLCIAALCLAVVSIAIAKAAVGPYLSAKYENRHNIHAIMDAVRDWRIEMPSIKINKIWLAGEVGKQNTLFFGDSLLLQYMPRAMDLIKTTNGGRGVLMLHRASHVAIPDSYMLGRENLKRNITKNMFTLLKNKDLKIDTVVIGAYWFKNYGYQFIDNEKPVLINGISTRTEYGKQLAMEKTRQMFAALPPGVKVYIVYSPPLDKRLNPRAMIKRSICPFKFEISRQYVSREEWMSRYREVYDFLQNLCAEYNFIFIDPADYLCRDNKCYAADVTGELIYKDDVHLRTSFVREKVRFLDAAILGQ